MLLHLYFPILYLRSIFIAFFAIIFHLSTPMIVGLLNYFSIVWHLLVFFTNPPQFKAFCDYFFKLKIIDVFYLFMFFSIISHPLIFFEPMLWQEFMYLSQLRYQS